MNSLILIGIIISVVASGSMTKAADIPVVKYIAGMAGTTALVIIAGLLFKLWLGLRGMKVELSRLTLLYRRLGRIYQLLVVAVYAAQIYLLHWPALVSWFAPATARSVLLAEVLVVMPFLILVYLSWLTFFSADRSFRRITARPTLTLSQYLILLTRQNLFIMLGPLMVLLAIRDVSVWSLGAQESEAMIGGVIFVSLGLFVVFSGVWMKLCFAATPMPAGGLRSRLEALASRARLRVRDILHWPTYSTILNGCVVGPIGRFRYIMMTDALLETLPAQEIEAVFAHEIGHIKHRHMLLYIAFIAGGLAAALGIAIGEFI
ncbi:MAG: M48 family metalloprotease, partial [Planctomycetia bacterium]|nr:M48 family metalloprotease [Planctomycetia bacterium]